jgi:hypothetical protein
MHFHGRTQTTPEGNREKKGGREKKLVQLTLYLLAKTLRDGSMIPPLNLRTKCRVDSFWMSTPISMCPARTTKRISLMSEHEGVGREQDNAL